MKKIKYMGYGTELTSEGILHSLDSTEPALDGQLPPKFKSMFYSNFIVLGWQFSLSG